MLYINDHVIEVTVAIGLTDSNPQLMEASHMLNDPTILVWDGVWEDQLISPYFFDTNVTGES